MLEGELAKRGTRERNAKETRKNRAKVQNNDWGLQHIITGMLVVYVVPKRKQNGHVAQSSRLLAAEVMRGVSREEQYTDRVQYTLCSLCKNVGDTYP